MVDEFIVRQARAMCYALGYCNDPILREFTCEECISEMTMTKDILTGEDHVADMVAFLQVEF